MPDRIARLPRDRRGFPVPWVSCWGSGEHGVGELTVDLGQIGVKVAGAVCTHVAGEGMPDLANLCSGNQILGMIERRCDVCGDVIDGPLHFVGAVDNETFREPPLHLECAVYSLQVCPGISTAAGVGVVVTGGYDMHPEFMLPDLSGGDGVAGIPGVKQEILRGFPEAVAYMQLSGLPGVCMGVHALPRNPVRILREHFLEEFA